MKEKNAEEIPSFLREAFSALREKDSNDRQSFVLSSAKINGEVHWIIAAVQLDEKGDISILIPIFQSIPTGLTISVLTEDGETHTATERTVQ